jgi:hypothetical protein
MSSTAYLTIRRYVITGRSNRPDLEEELNAAAAMVRWTPPYCTDTKHRTWIVPPDRAKGQAHIVDRLRHTCTCTHRRPSAHLCAHRLAVEMYCRLHDYPDPKET